MTWIERLNELRKLKMGYLSFICFDDDLKEVSNEFSQEIGRVSVEISKIEEMPVADGHKKIRFKTIKIESKL